MADDEIVVRIEALIKDAEALSAEIERMLAEVVEARRALREHELSLGAWRD